MAKIEAYQKENSILIKVGKTVITLCKTDERPWIELWPKNYAEFAIEEDLIKNGYQHLVISSA